MINLAPLTWEQTALLGYGIGAALAIPVLIGLFVIKRRIMK